MDETRLDEAVNRYAFVWHIHIRPHSYNNGLTPFESRFRNEFVEQSVTIMLDHYNLREEKRFFFREKISFFQIFQIISDETDEFLRHKCLETPYFPRMGKAHPADSIW